MDWKIFHLKLKLSYMWTFTNSFENLTFIFTFPEISPPAKALLFLNMRQWFNTTDKIILLCFASRFTEKLILFLKNFLCGIPSGHSSSQSGYLVALAAHPTWTCFPYTLSISWCVAVSWSWLRACRCYPNTYLHFSFSPKRWFPVFHCDYLGHCRPPLVVGTSVHFYRLSLKSLVCWGAKTCALHFEVIWP